LMFSYKVCFINVISFQSRCLEGKRDLQ